MSPKSKTKLVQCLVKDLFRVRAWKRELRDSRRFEVAQKSGRPRMHVPSSRPTGHLSKALYWVTHGRAFIWSVGTTWFLIREIPFKTFTLGGLSLYGSSRREVFKSFLIIAVSYVTRSIPQILHFLKRFLKRFLKGNTFAVRETGKLNFDQHFAFVAIFLKS